jgi:ketosteroid isomerase-like protein
MLSISLLTLPASGLAAQASRRDAREGRALSDSLRGFVLRMGDLLRARNAAEVIALYGDTTRFVHVENGTLMPWAQLAPLMRTFFAAAKSNPLTILGEPGVTVIDRNTAVVWAAHRFDASEGRPTHEGVWSAVLRRSAGGWKIVHSHSSDRRPGDVAR